MGDHPLMLYSQQTLPSQSSDLPSFPRRKVFPRRVQTFLIIFLSGFLLWEHLRRNTLDTCPSHLSHLYDLHDNTTTSNVEPLSTPINTLSLLTEYNDIITSHNWAMANETAASDFSGFADRVKVLLSLQKYSDKLNAIDLMALDEGTAEWTGRKHILEVKEDDLIQRLFPFINMNTHRKRTLLELRGTFTQERGIVIPVGNSQFQMALHLISTLKHVHKTSLPIQVVYAGGGDLDIQRRSALRSISPDIDVIDLAGYFDESEAGIVWGGWSIKPFAMLAAPFKQVIICDADAVFFQPPERLLEMPTYIRTGTVYFRDREIFPGQGDVHQWWHGVMEGREPSDEMKGSKFWNQLGSREELESGVVVYDKSRRDVLMGLMTVAWMNTRRVRDEVTYKLTYGDKESYWMAFELIGVPYAFNSREYASIIGQLTHGDSRAQFSNARICSDHILHLDHERLPFWSNGGLFQEKAFKHKGWFFATHYVDGTAEWECDPTPWCMVGIREHAVHRLSDTGLDSVLNHMIGTAAYWEAQFPDMLERHF